MTTEAMVDRAQGHGDVAALTFDDGPNGAVTSALLDLLAEHDIRAVFCLVGSNVDAPGGAALVRRMVGEGHQLANHAMTYADLGRWSSERVHDDLLATTAAIRRAAGDPDLPVPFFRAPNGSWGQSVPVAAELGMLPLAVTNTIGDWETQDVPTLVGRLRMAVRAGELVLVHDGGGDRWGSLAALTVVLRERLEQGWRFTLPADPRTGGSGRGSVGRG